MEHRERIRKDAEMWQKTSVRIIWWIRTGVLVFGISVILLMFLSNLGFPRKVQEILPARIITEDGITLECNVEIQGEITNYPLKIGRFSRYGPEDQVTVWINGKQLGRIDYYGGERAEYLLCKLGSTVCVLSVKRDSLLLETDIQNLFPDMKSQRCIVYYGYDSFDLPGEYAELFTFFVH